MDLMADAKTILKWRSYFFDEGEPEIKTGFLPWLGKATEEADDVNALTVAIREAVKNGTMRHEARLPVFTIRVMKSNDAEVRRNRLYHLKLMFPEDVAPDRIHQDRTKPKSRPTDKGPEEEDAVHSTVNFVNRTFCVVNFLHFVKSCQRFSSDLSSGSILRCKHQRLVIVFLAHKLTFPQCLSAICAAGCRFKNIHIHMFPTIPIGITCSAIINHIQPR
jgi:hypothetical protein